MKKKIGRMTAMQNIADGIAKEVHLSDHPLGEVGGRVTSSRIEPDGTAVITGFEIDEVSIRPDAYEAAKILRPSPSRPTWADTNLEIAAVLSRRGTCPRLKTGAVVTTHDHQLLAACYNGAPRGTKHCIEAGCIIHDSHCVRAIHAEQNAILQAIATGYAGDMLLYSTHRPCIVCTRLLLQYKVVEVNYREDYDSDGLREVCAQLLTEKKVGHYKC